MKQNIQIFIFSAIGLVLITIGGVMLNLSMPNLFTVKKLCHDSQVVVAYQRGAQFDYFYSKDATGNTIPCEMR